MTSVTSFGIDCDFWITPDFANCLKDSGHNFVGRYYGRTKKEPLTRHEAQMLTGAELFTAPVWESGYPTSADYFSVESGQEDGTYCFTYAYAMEQPKCSTIYFAVDYDATEEDVVTRIMPYFGAIRDAFSEGTGNPSGTYLLGVYGSGMVCHMLYDAGFVHHTWLAYAPGWQGNDTYAEWSIKQTGVGQVRCGATVDLDEARGESGAFKMLK